MARPPFKSSPIRSRPNPRAAMLCTEWVKSHNGAANFDQLYRMLMEQGFESSIAHLAVEDFMRTSMLKKTRRPAS